MRVVTRFLGVAALVAAFCVAQEDALAKLYREARTAEQAADYSTAIDRYERIVALRPDLAEAYANLGNLYYAQGRHDRAAAVFKRAIQIKPQLARPYFFLGLLAFNARDFEGAARYLNKAESLEPGNVLAELYLGYTHYARSRYEEAAAVLEKVVRAETSNEDAWYHLSKIYGQLSKRHFDRLQKHYPDSFYTHLARAHFFEAQGNWSEAAGEYERALAIQPTGPLERKLEWIRAKAKRMDSPRPAGSAAVEGSAAYLHDPPQGTRLLKLLDEGRDRVQKEQAAPASSPEALYALAEDYQLLSFLSSLAVFEGSPDSYRAHQLKAESLEVAGRSDEAVEEYRKALEKKPELQAVHFAIGNLYWRNARLEEALPELLAELRASPDDPQAHYEIGDILFSQGKVDEAVTHFQKALQYAPSTPEAHLALERIYTSREDYPKALFHLRKAAEISPQDATPYYRMWLLYRKLGKMAEAQKARQMFDKLKSREKR